MGWAQDRARLLADEPPVMSVDEIFSTLLARDAVLYLDGGQLRYSGPDHGDADPLAPAIDAHRAVLTELFTYVPDGRCVFTDCYRLRAGGDRIACAEHRQRMEDQP